MNKLFTKVIAVLVICIVSFNMLALAEENPITVYLDGSQLEFDVDPVLENGRTLVPMRVIFESLGAEVSWDAETWTAIAVKDDITIKITIDEMKMYKNDEVIELDVPARLIDSRTLVPARAVSEGMGADVDWNQEAWAVLITTDDLEVSLGTVVDNTYKNEFIGIGVELEDDWIYLSEEEIMSINDSSLNLFDDDYAEQLKKADYFMDMMAVKISGENINIGIENIKDYSFLTEETLAEIVKQQLNAAFEQSEVSFISTDVVQRDFAGEQHYGINAKSTVEGKTIYSEQVVIKLGNYAVYVTLTSAEEGLGDKVFPLFYSIK